MTDRSVVPDIEAVLFNQIGGNWLPVYPYTVAGRNAYYIRRGSSNQHVLRVRLSASYQRLTLADKGLLLVAHNGLNIITEQSAKLTDKDRFKLSRNILSIPISLSESAGYISTAFFGYVAPHPESTRKQPDVYKFRTFFAIRYEQDDDLSQLGVQLLNHRLEWREMEAGFPELSEVWSDGIEEIKTSS